MLKGLTLAGVVLLTTAFTPVAQLSRDPLGESASYQLDKNRVRTTGMIQSGSAVTTVTDFLPNRESGPAYNVDLTYDFTVAFYGRKQGTVKWEFEKEFFEPEFMVKLRQNGTYETPNYKVRHEGYADATNMDGVVYPHCDVITIYDVVIPSNGGQGLKSILVAAAGLDPEAFADPTIEDVKIRANIIAGTPVLGAVKLDLTGVVQGMNVKAGFDYHR
jgi:hypothetical protein